MNLGELRWPELDGRGPRLLAIPIGAVEQHGPHLPLWTDTAIATELVRRIAAERRDLAAAPAIPVGASGEHAAFPGTLSIGHQALRNLLVELVRSADHFAGVVLVNGHGGNLPALRSAVELLRYEARNVLSWSPDAPPDDTHAGHTETSAMLALHPEHVRMDLAAPGNTAPLPDLLPALRAGGTAAAAPSGVLGDPTTATPGAGREVLDRWTRDLGTRLRSWV